MRLILPTAHHVKPPPAKGFKLIHLIEQNSAVTFCLMWLAITTFLSVLSGWFRLMLKFPNRDEPPLLRIRMVGGSMGLGVSLRGILTLSACPSGLRVGMLRLFGPFCRDFFVPWESIAATHETSLFSQGIKLHFGNPVIGTLRIPQDVADQLAFTASGRWPRTGSGPEETLGDISQRLLIQWAVLTGSAVLFVTLAPTLGLGGNPPPISLAILFPTVIFGLVAIVRLCGERR
jgi:hypothetical protein